MCSIGVGIGVGLGGGSGAIAPDSAGLTAWLEDQSALSVSDVNTWTDKSGGARHFSGTTAKPTWEATGGPNGRPCISFDGVDDFLVSSTATSTLITDTAYTVYVVIKVAQADVDTDAVAPYNDDCIFFDTSGRAGCGLSQPTGGYLIRSFNDDGTDDQVNGAMSDNAWIIIRQRHLDGTLYQKRGANAEDSTASGTSVALGANIRIGNYVTAGKELKGRIAAFLFYNDGAIHAATEAYLASRFGLPI
jgi:hypothetical protein